MNIDGGKKKITLRAHISTLKKHKSKEKFSYKKKKMKDNKRSKHRK